MKSELWNTVWVHFEQNISTILWLLSTKSWKQKSSWEYIYMFTVFWTVLHEKLWSCDYVKGKVMCSCELYYKSYVHVSGIVVSLCERYDLIWFDFLCLMPLSAVFQLYHGDQFYWWKKPEYPERTTDHGQATGKLYHLRLRVECTLFCNLQSRARTHAVLVIGLYELLGNPIT